MKFVVSFIWMCCFCFFAEAKFFDAKVHTLKNGLTLIVIENHRAPLVTHMMCFRIGTNESPWGKSGIAHYLEHLMFKGKPGSTPQRFMKEVNRLGGESNAATSAQYTFYHETIPVSALEAVMAMDAERMTKLDIQDDWAVPEINVILEERYMRIDNTVLGNFFETLNAFSIHHHPSRLPVIGWVDEIKNYTTQDAKNFYNKWYAPNNAFIVIAGDVDFEKAKMLVDKYYGALPAKDLPQRLALNEPPFTQVAQNFTMTSEISDAPMAILRYPAPTFNEGQHQQFYALNVLEDVLGRAVTGRLTKALMEKKHVASQIQVSYDGLKHGPGFFDILIMPTPNTSLSDLEKALVIEIDHLIKLGVSEEEIETAKDYIVSNLVYTQDNVIKAAQNIAFLHACGMSIDQIEAWPDAIKSVTLNQINTALRQVLSNSQPMTGYLLPKKKNLSEKALETKND